MLRFLKAVLKSGKRVFEPASVRIYPGLIGYRQGQSHIVQHGHRVLHLEICGSGRSQQLTEAGIIVMQKESSQNAR